MKKVPFPVFVSDPADCPDVGKITADLVFVGAGSAPTFIKEGDGKIKI